MFDAFREALRMIVRLDAELLCITLVSLKVTTISTLLATAIGVPMGFIAATVQFPGSRALAAVFNAMMAVPTVVIGLLVYSCLSRAGPLGSWGLLYTQTAIVIGQCILATPLIAALSLSAVRRVNRKVRETALSLGAGQIRAMWAVLSEARLGVLSSIAAGFGRVFGEVGVSMILGGNIRGFTRTIPTAIAFQTSKGEFTLGLALGMILLGVALGINVVLQLLGGGHHER